MRHGKAIAARLAELGVTSPDADEAIHDALDLCRSPHAWLNTPSPDLDGATPAELILSGKGQVVVDLLADALTGHPG